MPGRRSRSSRHELARGRGHGRGGRRRRRCGDLHPRAWRHLQYVSAANGGARPGAGSCGPILPGRVARLSSLNHRSPSLPPPSPAWRRPSTFQAAVILAHSLGTIVAQHLAAQHETLVRKLILLGALIEPLAGRPRSAAQACCGGAVGWSCRRSPTRSCRAGCLRGEGTQSGGRSFRARKHSSPDAGGLCSHLRGAGFGSRRRPQGGALSGACSSPGRRTRRRRRRWRACWPIASPARGSRSCPGAGTGRRVERPAEVNAEIRRFI